MKTILLVCNAGMSTSMLVKKMEQVVEKRGLDVKVSAKSLTEAKKDWTGVDMVLIGPQIRYELKNVQSMVPHLPVEAINMQDYGMMNGEKVLDQALKAMGL